MMQHPELFGAVVCQVPLIDMLRYTQIGAGASWEGEYGDPADPQDGGLDPHLLALSERAAQARNIRRCCSSPPPAMTA